MPVQVIDLSGIYILDMSTVWRVYGDTAGDGGDEVQTMSLSYTVAVARYRKCVLRRQEVPHLP